MRKVIDFMVKVTCSVLMFVISYCFGINAMGVVAVAFKLENAETIKYGVWGICVVLFLVVMFLYWSGRMSTKTVKGIKCCKCVVWIGLGGIVLSSVLYMVILKEMLQTMLILAVVTWLVLFMFIRVLSSIEKSLSSTEAVETVPVEESCSN